MHQRLLHNGDIRLTSEALLSPGQVGFMNGWGVFSTLLVHNGVLFAFERHWARMTRDAVRMRVPMPWSAAEFESLLLRLVEANEAWNATLRCAVVRNRGGLFEGAGISRDADLIAFTTGLRSWGESVRLGVVPQARHAESEFAGAKITSWCQNLVMYERAHDQGLDEVVLLNERDEVSECTSANIFIMRGRRALTPPLSSGCLGGITREVLLEEIRVPGFEAAEQTLLLNDLETADSVFITSSTRGLLAVREIEGLRIRWNPEAFGPLNEAFQQYLRSYAAARAGQPREIGNAANLS